MGRIQKHEPLILHKSLEKHAHSERIHLSKRLCIVGGALFIVIAAITAGVIYHNERYDDLWLAKRIHPIFLRTHFDTKQMTPQERDLMLRFSDRAKQILDNCYRSSGGKSPCSMTGKEIDADTAGGELVLQYPPCGNARVETNAPNAPSGLDAIQWPCHMTPGERAIAIEAVKDGIISP